MNRPIFRNFADLILAAALAACTTTEFNAPIHKGNTLIQKAPPGYHRIQPGENLYRISLKYHTTVASLKELNHLTDSSQIQVGTLLRVSPNTYYLHSHSVNHSSAKSSSAAAYTHQSNTPTSLAGLHFIWPLKGPITQGFNGALNKGIDIATNKGTPIKAAEKGKVIYSGPVTGYGYILILSHNSKNTVLSVYSHATGLRVKLGNQVQKGDILALLEGNSFHFEIRQDGQAINPVPYLY